MKITPTPGPIVHTTADGPQRFEEGVEVDVPEMLGVYFVMSGWASYDPSTVSAEARGLLPALEDQTAPSQDPGPIDLTVQDITQTSQAASTEVQ